MNKNGLSNKDKVLIYMQKNKSITSWDAIQIFKATRLSDLIFRLRRDGYNIISQHEKNENTGKNYVRYILKNPDTAMSRS